MTYRLIAIGIMIAAVGFFVWDYTNTKSENKRLNAEIESANSTIEKLDEKLETEQTISDQKDQIIRKIRNAPKNKDAPLAPVLRDTIIELQDHG